MKYCKMLLALIAVSIVLCSCGSAPNGRTEMTNTPTAEQSTSATETSSTDKTEVGGYEGAITIYYVNTNGMSGLNTILSEAKKVISERFEDRVTIEAVAVSSYEELTNKIINEGMPDLVYIDDLVLTGSFDPYDLAERGLIVSFSPYIRQAQEDGLMSEDEYFTGVLEAGMMNGEQILFPVSISTNYLMTSKKEWEENSLLNTLDENYELAELLEAIEADIEMHETDLYWALAPLAMTGITHGQLEVSFLQETGILQINRDNGSWSADPETMKIGIDYLKAFGESRNKMFSDNAVQTDNLDVLIDRYLFVAGSWNVPYVGRYYESAYSQFADQELVMTYYPSVSEGYGVTVNEYVLLGGSEESRYIAFQVADILARTKADAWVGANYGDFINLMTSPVKSVFAEEVEALENNSGKMFKFPTSGKTFTREALSEELGESMLQWSEEIRHAGIYDTQVIDVFEDAFRSYLNGEDSDFNGSYQRFEEGMNEIIQ